MQVLVIEDDIKTAELMTTGLRAEGLEVDVCHDGAGGFDKAIKDMPDVIVLDVMLPVMDGWTVLERLRQTGAMMPVLMLTARDGVEQRIKGLSLGADDYIVKPFALAELVARIHAVMRRARGTAVSQLQYDDLLVDRHRHAVARNGTAIDLSGKEFMLLQLLLEHQGQVLTRDFIAERVWDVKMEGDSNVVDVNIRRIRAKIDEPYERKLIHTVRGRGYVLR